MIFTPDDLALIRERRKTQHRIPAVAKCPVSEGRVYRACCQHAGWTARDLMEHRRWADGEHPTRARAVTVYLDDPLDAALREPAPADVTIMDIQLGTLGAVSQQDAQREGFRFLAQFVNRWESTHGPWQPRTPIWVMTFEVGDHRYRFDQVTRLQATPGPPALWDAYDHQDYTSAGYLAMREEPEAISGLDQQRFTTQAHRRDEERRQAERLALSRAQRLQEIEKAASSGDQHARQHLRLIDRRIEAAERKRRVDEEQAA